MRLMRRSPSSRERRTVRSRSPESLIDLFSKNRKLQRVIARANATAVSDSMTLKSDTIDLRIRNDVLDHAYAWGAKSRAKADSPSQNLARRFARRDDAGTARSSWCARSERRYAEGQARHDALQARSVRHARLAARRHDRRALRHARTAKDTSKAPNIKQLVASGHASSLYHHGAERHGERRPAINYRDRATDHDRFRQQNRRRHGDDRRFGVRRLRRAARRQRDRRAAPSATPARRRTRRQKPTGPSSGRSSATQEAVTRVRPIHARVRALVDQLARGDRSTALALHALISAADAGGVADFDRATKVYRDDHLGALRASGPRRRARSRPPESGRSPTASVASVLPRLAADGIIVPPLGGCSRGTTIRFTERVGQTSAARATRSQRRSAQTGEHAGVLGASRGREPATIAQAARPSAAASSRRRGSSRHTDDGASSTTWPFDCNRGRLLDCWARMARGRRRRFT